MSQDPKRPNISVVLGQSIPPGYILGRVSKGTGRVELIPLSQVGGGKGGTNLDSLGATQGDILYRSATAWTVLPPGTAGYVLQTGGSGANPSWVDLTTAAPVTAVFGRTGAITAAAGDYTAAQVTNALDLTQTATQTMVGPLAVTGAGEAFTAQSAAGSYARFTIMGESNPTGGIFARYSSDTGVAALSTRKARGSIASPSVVASGDISFQFASQFYDGTTFRNSGILRQSVIAATPSSTDMQGQWTFLASKSGSVNPTAMLTVDWTGGAVFAVPVMTPASATADAGLNLPHGTAPTSPANGDFWSTSLGFYGRVAGTTVGPFAASTSGPEFKPPLASDFATVSSGLTLTDSTLGLGLSGTAATGTLRYAVKAFTDADKTVIARLTSSNFEMNYNGVGIIFRNSGSSKSVTLGITQLDSSNNFKLTGEGTNWSADTTIVGGLGGNLSFRDGELWVKAVYTHSTNTLAFSISKDGINWRSVVSTTYIGVPSQYGVCVLCRNGSNAANGSVSYWAES